MVKVHRPNRLKVPIYITVYSNRNILAAHKNNKLWKKWYIQNSRLVVDMWWTGYLFRFADHWQDNPALVCGFTGKQFLYKDVTALTKKFGSHLLENGFSPGDKIATIVPNCPEFGPVLLGSLGKIKIMFW